jgi:hypothetical protein
MEDKMSKYEDGFRNTEEGEPILEMNMKFGEDSIPLSLTRDNTAIFTHEPPYDYLDHVFVELAETPDDEEYRAIGAFIWRQVLPDWDDLKEALDKRWFQHIRSPFPSEPDMEQYESTNLKPPSLFDRPKEKEVKVIEEVEDDDVVSKVMEKIDHELNWFLNDPHFYDRIKPRKEDGEK